MGTLKVYKYKVTNPTDGYDKIASRMATKEYIEKYADGWIIEGSEIEIDDSKVDSSGKTQIGFKG